MRPDTTFQPTADAGPRCDIRATDANRPRRLDAAAVSSFATPAISCLCALGMVVTCRGSSMMRANARHDAARSGIRCAAATKSPVVHRSITPCSVGPGSASTTAGRLFGSATTDASRTSSNEGGCGSLNPRRAAARFASASACASLHGSHRPPSEPARQYRYPRSVPCAISSSRIRRLPGGIPPHLARSVLALRLTLQLPQLTPLLLRRSNTLIAQLLSDAASLDIPTHTSSVERRRRKTLAPTKLWATFIRNPSSEKVQNHFQNHFTHKDYSHSKCSKHRETAGKGAIR